MIAVVHLVWGPLGAAPLERFCRSYARHPAGVDHELVVLWNGTDPELREQLAGCLAGIPHRDVVLADPVQDLAAYRMVAAELTHRRVCFLNSHSVLGAGAWLAKLEAALAPGVPTIAGASGSWMSVRSTYLGLLGLPVSGADRSLSRRVAVAEMGGINAELREEGGAGAPAPMTRRLAMAVRRVLGTPAFPNPHIRTNGFLLDRELFLRLLPRGPVGKLDAYGVEAGPDSLTAQLLAGRGRAHVVDRDGDVSAAAQWSANGTFWQDTQDRLLVADNQTRLYDRGGPDRRRTLAGWAWGDVGRAGTHAEPGESMS